jgi:hypothetical protein
MATAVIISATPEENGSSERITEISDRMLSAIKQEFANSPDVYAIGAIRYHWFDDENVNSGRCDRCGAWVTDRNKPDPLNGLPEAAIVGDKHVCDQCRMQELGG